MKKILFCLVSLVLLFGSFEAKANEVAVINLEEIVNNSIAMNKFKKKLEAQKSDMEKKLKVEEKSLKDEQTALEAQSKMLSQEMLQQKAIALQDKINTFQNKVKDSENELQKNFMDAYVQLTNNIKDIIVNMKNEKNNKYTFDVVIPQASTLYSNSDIDISGEVLKRLNNKLKEIK